MENQIQTGASEPQKGKKQWKWMIIVFILLLLLGLAAGYIYRMKKDNELSRLARDEMALGGMLPGKTPEEIQDLLNAKVEEGMVDIRIAAEPVFEYNGSRGLLGIENVPGNSYSFQVVLTLGNGEVIYESGLIDPGYYIDYVTLARTLQAGDYQAVATFTTYSLDESESEIAEAQVNVTLHIMDGKFY